MTYRRRYEITVLEFGTLLSLEHHHTMEIQIHTDKILKKEEMLFMYAPRAKPDPPKIQNFLPKLNCLHRLLQATLAPRIGDATAYPQYELNLIMYYVDKKPFCVVNYFLVEILNISKSPLRSCGDAPQIMMMIEKVSGIEFVKDTFITDIKPQASIELIITKGMPSFSAACSTHSDMAPPPPTSSSGGGLLRVLKSMFHMCQDTRQCQDILLTIQHRQNEKLNIDESDEFPLVEPPLDEDLFASLTPPTWQLWGLLWVLLPSATTTAASMRMGRMKMMMISDPPQHLALLFFPFWCLDAKGGEEISIYV
jgi:hypothetical protein